jgi:hypothetical protein
MQYIFGTGSLILIPAGANPTPVQVGTLQECSIDPEFQTKELRGQYQFPVAVAQTAASLKGTAKAGNINGALINSLLAGGTQALGASVRGAINEPGTIPGTPYQLTVVNSATFTVDCGVYDVTAQRPLVRVASAPATGQYSVAAGVYTFAAADTGNVVWISYAYTSTSGTTVSYTNQLMGQGTQFALNLFNQSFGKFSGIKLWAVQLAKLSFPFKNEDFMISDLMFTAFADSNGRVIDTYTAE